ncbi:hypothetical protein [Pseudomonas guariconensis]|uniref:hypothetical protein n=1 Tax=Pseudomonas guariconensis TaxID=1288410 RepID=UPI0018AACEA3|nr:hypothetical protein [Pseudomonas guariconensis]MBF8722479.1 hypothetical protein [Pseudomonas guariconensis]MBF8793286.1 hypothetical protein [Pseudomonas monteilii]
MASQSTHFVKYRLKDSAQGEHYLTFSSRAPRVPVDGKDHALVRKVAETDQQAADAITWLIQEMTANEQRFFAWLGGDASRMEHFMQDPIGALKQAIPELSEAFYAQLAALPKLYARRR